MFDLFHTLIDPEPHKPSGYHYTVPVAELLQLDLDAFRRFWVSTAIERETTPVDLVDVVERYVAPTGRRLTSSERAEIDRLIGIGPDAALGEPDPAILDLLAELEPVVRIGVLSNCYEREVRRWPSSPLAPLVRSFVRSCDVGAMKPDPSMYAAVLGSIDVDATDAVFVGNGAGDELAGAARSGFGQVVHCNVFDRHNGLASPGEQRRRSAQSDVSVDTIGDLRAVLMARL